MLQLNDRESAVFRSLSESSEGEVLLAYFRRLIVHVTDTRQLKGTNLEAELAGANKASAIIEENLIQPLMRTQKHKGTYERFD